MPELHADTQQNPARHADALIGPLAEQLDAVADANSNQSSAVFQTLDGCARNNYTRGEYIRRILWQFVQATLYRVPIPRSYPWRRFLLRCFGARMGHRAGVHPTTRIMHPWLLVMGDWT